MLQHAQMGRRSQPHHPCDYVQLVQARGAIGNYIRETTPASSRNADEPHGDCRSRKKLLRSNDNRDGYHHERIHDSKREFNCHRRSADIHDVRDVLRELFA